MKTLSPKTPITLLPVALLAFAFAPAVTASPLADRTIQKASNVSKLVERKAYGLDKSELNKINNLLEKIKSVAHGDMDDDDGFFDPGPLSTITANIESSPYSFKVKGTADLLMQCLEQRSGNASNTDDIEVTLNYTQSKTIRNSSSWWKGSLATCAALAEAASDLGLKKGVKRGKFIVGFSVEGKESMTHTVQGKTATAIGDKCMNKLEMDGNADDIAISVNGKQFVELHNSSSWWKTKSEVCTLVVQAAADSAQ